MKGFKRDDDYASRRSHLKDLTDNELKERFWSLMSEIVDPLIKLAKENTSPSIERSVLLRMGFSSLEAKPIVDLAIDNGLINYGVGHIVYLVSKEKNISIRDAGLSLLDGKNWDIAIDKLKGGNNA